MTRERYELLMASDDLDLTPDEVALGWHFCSEFDCLLVGPEMSELSYCSCWPKEHQVYKTVPQ